jgi:phage regulator Rha-like protein
MKMSIKKVLELKRDLNQMYEMNKTSNLAKCFGDEHLKTMTQIRGAVEEIDRQLQLIEVEFDLNKMYLSKFNFKLDDEV